LNSRERPVRGALRPADSILFFFAFRLDGGSGLWIGTEPGTISIG